MKKFSKLLLVVAALVCVAFTGKAEGWPANFQGVMLQGFWWDSHETDTQWLKLEAKADEYSAYFKLIWVPNSAQSSGGLGYLPIYWFTNHNSSMGSEAALRSMINAYKKRGTGIIADLVINHRVGRTNWADFPTETWNGQTWKIGPEGICRDDEWASNGGNPTGNNDTGDRYDGGRDLDHTNANVQNNCKNYEKCLLTDFGYVGFRVDYSKGYGGQYLKMYNQYAKPTYCVGEYWDGSYDACAAWIESTGKESAAFDFPFKYAVNEAFASNDMTKLVWKANGSVNQPAGLIHWWYPQYAVTFIDNHDTYRDHNKFGGNVVAANAFMLCSPGTPCVFLPHYNQYKNEIQQLIAIRNAVGVTNTSAVTVLESYGSCYMAEVTGTKGKLVVKIGSAQVSPNGYSNSDIKASGNDYCVWTKVNVSKPEIQVTLPDHLYLQGTIPAGHWQPNTGVEMEKSGKGFIAKSVVIDGSSATATKGNFSFCTALAETSASSQWDAVVNKSNRYGATADGVTITVDTPTAVTTYYGGSDASACKSWAVAKGTYDVAFNFETMKVTLYAEGTMPENPNGTSTGGNQSGNQGGNIEDPNPGNYPANLYAIGNFNKWNTTNSVAPTTTKSGVYTWDSIELKDSGDGSSYFTFVTAQGADWNAVNGSDRYGAGTKDEAISGTATITKYAANVNASGANSWKIAPGTYKIVVDLAKMTVTTTQISTGGGVDPEDPEVPETTTWTLYLTADASTNNNPHAYFWDAGNGDKRYLGSWPGTKMTKDNVSGYYVVTFTTTDNIKTPMIIFNNGGDSQKTKDLEAVNNGLYDMSGYKSTYTPIDPTPGNYPAHVYLIGDLKDSHWATDNPLEGTPNNGVYTWKNVEFETAYDNDFGFFSFITAKGTVGDDTDWDVINLSDRYAPADNEELSVPAVSTIVKYEGGNIGYLASWSIAPGFYDVTVDLTTMTLTVAHPTAGPVVGDIDGDRLVNSVDLGIIINMIIGNLTPNVAADINGDGYVNSVDLGCIINIICGN